MKVEVLENNPVTFRFSVKGIDTNLANAIRRSSMGMVECFAIDSITVYENTSAMFDEYIAHRIGMIPITTPSKGYSGTDQIMFTLDVVGPKTVYSEDMETRDKEVGVADEHIPIIKLADGQRLRLDGKAVMRPGSKHAKFSPGIVAYEEKDNATYEFSTESFGQMQAKEMINNAIEAIRAHIKELQKEVKKL
jgi:DNA-directed RNA polymerase subunit D